MYGNNYALFIPPQFTMLFPLFRRVTKASILLEEQNISFLLALLEFWGFVLGNILRSNLF